MQNLKEQRACIMLQNKNINIKNHNNETVY